MKRMLVTAISVLATTAAFAAPASAQEVDPGVYFDVAICQYGETYTECAFRIARDADDIVIDLAEAYANAAGQAAGDAIDTAKALCAQVIRTCGTAL